MLPVENMLTLNFECVVILSQNLVSSLMPGRVESVCIDGKSALTFKGALMIGSCKG